MSSSRFTPCITGLVYGTLWDYHLQQCFVSPYLLVIAAVLCLETSVSTSLGDSCLPFYQPTWFPPWQSETFYLVSPLLLRLFCFRLQNLPVELDVCLQPTCLPVNDCCQFRFSFRMLDLRKEKWNQKRALIANDVFCPDDPFKIT